MLISFILIALIAFGGLALTYLFAREGSFLWRLAAGNIIGSTIFGTIGFLVACLFGLSAPTVLFALLIVVLPLFLFREKDFRDKFAADWNGALAKMRGTNFKTFLRFSYYAFFFLLFIFFFDRAVYETADGLFTGDGHNFGDLPLHLGAIYSFTEGNNFPPENPSFAGAKFTYPFIADFLTACLMKLGANLKDAMLAQNVFWAFSLLIILEKFIVRLTENRLAGKIAPVILFFSGGLGFLWFFDDFWHQSKNFADFITHLPRDYTIGMNFHWANLTGGDSPENVPELEQNLRWGNSLVTLFLTQRSLLLGMPLTIIVLQKLWKVFAPETPQNAIANVQPNDAETAIPPKNLELSQLVPLFFVGVFAGTLPLIHLHSLAVLFVVTAFLFFLKIEKWREWLAFGAGVCIIAVPELLWSVSGSATRTSEFIGWNFGWNKNPNESVVLFWLKNTGIFIPLALAGIYFVWEKIKDEERETRDAEDLAIERREQNSVKTAKPEEKTKKETGEKRLNSAQTENRIGERKSSVFSSSLVPRPKSLLLFFLPFIFLFLISNIAKFAPWEWDNIKILIYWFVAALPFVAVALALGWRKNVFWKIASVGALVVLIFSGALDVWRVTSKQINNFRVFERDAMIVAEQIKQRTAPNALFLNAPTFNSAVVLSGRRSLMRFTGHLGSHGIDYAEREQEVRKIYEGGATADIFLRKNNIEYVLISPEERSAMPLNENFFARYPVVAESGQYRVYKIK